MKFFYFDEIYKGMQELVEYYTNTPIKTMIIHHLVIISISIVIIIVERLWESYPFYPKSFEYSMVDSNGVYISRSDDGGIDLVSGSFKHFLDCECDISEYSDEELNGIILKYCKYVDKVYGKSPEFAKKNFGKDYKALLNGDLI